MWDREVSEVNESILPGTILVNNISLCISEILGINNTRNCCKLKTLYDKDVSELTSVPIWCCLGDRDKEELYLSF